MPKYKKKITRSMGYKEFKEAIEWVWSSKYKAFLTLLFFSGCRVSEALALTDEDIHCMEDTIFVQFHRLKGSKQTDPTEIPKADALLWLCEQEGELFTFTRVTEPKKYDSTICPSDYGSNRLTTATCAA